MAATSASLPRIGPPERAFAWVGAVLVLVSLAFWSASASMVSVWNTSGTYSHGFFVVPAFLWLAWGRRQALAALPVQPAWSGVFVVAVVGAMACVADWTALSLLSHLALVAMVPAVIAGAFGWSWVRALAFPLAFLFFAVPFGDSLVPVLMDWTADFTVAALKLSGVPVFRDGLHFDIPSGRWSVVDSCSGIRYLFACLTVSSLYSWTIYRGTGRRLIFVGVAAVIAIIANWIRAYAIVMLGHLSDNRVATGADHLVYGALFFAVIMALVFALGVAWREDPAAGDAQRRAATAHDAPPTSSTARTRAAVAIATAVSLMVSAALVFGTNEPSGPVAASALEIRPGTGWAPSDTRMPTWHPQLNKPAAVLSRSFNKGSLVVGVHIGLFGRPTAESKLTSSTNRLVKADGLDPHWKLAWQGPAQMRWGGTPIEVRAGVLVGEAARLRVWQWYWVDGVATANPLRASALQMLARLRGRGEVSAWMTVYTPETEDGAGAGAALEDFVAGLSVAPNSDGRRVSLQ